MQLPIEGGSSRFRVNAAMREGLCDLSGGSFLAKLLDQHRRKPRRKKRSGGREKRGGKTIEPRQRSVLTRLVPSRGPP